MTAPLPPITAAQRLRERSDRPEGLHAMWNTWRDLLFLHWSFPVETVQALLPPGLAVDSWDGRAWVGVVPFEMENIRPRFIPPVPGISYFLELNVRTYVVDSEGRTGVWFFALDCNQPLAVSIGNRVFRLLYRHAQMHVHHRQNDWTHYVSGLEGSSWEGAARFRWRPSEAPVHKAAPGSLEEFLVERYRYFGYDFEAQRMMTGLVRHEPYDIAPAEVAEARVATLFHSVGLPEPEGPLESALWSPVAKVKIHLPRWAPRV